MELVLYIAGATTGVAGALAAVTQWVIRPALASRRRLRNFLDDWAGEAPRPGVPARPGVMERLGSIEHQLYPNSGGSLRDAVDATRALLEDHLADDNAHGHGSPR